MVKDGDGHWYLGTKKANLTNGKNYTASVTLTQLPALTNESAEGTIGVVGGLPAIVVNFSGTKKAVAMMNVGALCPEAYGSYYTFANRASGLSNGWNVPEQSEWDALVAKSNAWGAQNGVNGRLFTIGSNKLFLPAGGLDDTDNDPSDYYNVSTYGYYWSKTMSSTLPICLSFGSSSINTLSDYPTDALSIRPFHAL